MVNPSKKNTMKELEVGGRMLFEDGGRHADDLRSSNQHGHGLFQETPVL